jgi:hypothetical protein
VLARVATRRSATLARRPIDLAPPRACALALGVPHPSVRSPLLATGIARWSTTDPPEAPPPASVVHPLSAPLSHDQNPAIELVGFPSPVLANSGDLKPPGAYASLVSGDCTAADGSSVGHRAVNPLAFDLSRPSPIKRPRSLGIGSRAPYPWVPLAGRLQPWHWARLVSPPSPPEPLTALARLLVRARALALPWDMFSVVDLRSDDRERPLPLRLVNLLKSPSDS